MAYSDEELLEDIRAVADVVKRSPSLQDYRDHGAYAATTITRRFNSWQGAVARAGFEPHDADAEIPEAELVEELQRLGDELGKSPTVEAMNTDGKYWASTYKRRFGSWSAALTEAGFEPADARMEDQISHEDLLTAIERLAVEVDGPPTFQDMDDRGAYAARTYVNRFGSWNAAVEAAGFEPRSSGRVDDAELLADLRRLRETLGRKPTSTDVREHGQYGLATYQRRFGSWSAALDAALEDE